MARCGTRAAYKRGGPDGAGCRCLLCRAANAEYAVRWARARARPRPGAGTAKERSIEARRFVRRLVIEGYPKSRIAKLAGWPDGRAYHVTFRPGQGIRRSTYERILRLARFALLEEE